MRRKATVAVLPERLSSEMLEWTEDIVVIRALQTATRRPDLLRDLVVSRVPSDRRDRSDELELTSKLDELDARRNQAADSLRRVGCPRRV